MRKFVSVVLALMAAGASAQEAPPAKVEKRAEPLEDIERGFFFSGRGGLFAIANPPGVGSSFSVGQAAGAELGIDIGERLELAVFFLGSFNRMSSAYTGLSPEGATVSGDFGAFTPGAAVKVRIVGFDDSQEVKRTWIYARAGAGVSFFTPQQLLTDLGLLALVGAGVEYYTQLRHLVIGVEADFNLHLFFGAGASPAVGFAIYPTVKYAF